eukprot:gene26613-35286_t
MASSWEILPPREKRQSNNKKRRLAAISNSDGSCSIDSKETSNFTAQQQNIEDNIEKRSSQTRANRTTTLQSKDGCGGEFFEYLDHTADVQCHVWGKSMEEAFQTMAVCLINYMTDISLIEIVDEETISINVTGHDFHSLLYNYMNELLFKFSADSFCTKKVEITSLVRGPAQYSIAATLYGDIFDLSKHSSGTEVKAITYSNMQIHETPERVDLYVIVDI